MMSDKEIDRFSSQLSDRFGKLPDEVDNLFKVVKIRNLGAALGFDKIIIKNGLMIMFFISNPMSPYYKSSTFEQVLRKSAESQIFNFKQVENKLKLVVRNVGSLEKALSILRKLQ